MRRILLERYGAVAAVSVMQDDIKAALAELPADASQEEIRAAARR